MANHKSALKRIRNSETRRLRNRYQHKTARTALKNFKETDNKEEAKKLLPDVVSKIDKLAKKNIIHKNKAAHLKSGLERYISTL